jgi:hypothetical protein
MGPKLVLVIALLGAASLSWLASAERGDVVEKDSLMEQCRSQIEQYKKYYPKNPVLVVEENFNSYLNENMEALIKVSDEAEKRGEGRGKSIEKWVTELGIVEQMRFYEICKRFLEDTQCAWDQFAIRVYRIQMEPPQSKYFSYADKHCKTILYTIEEAREEKKLKLEDAEEMLKSQSLERDVVAEILARLDKALTIDGVRVGELLLPDWYHMCDVGGQERRMNHCKNIETQSLRNHCEGLVDRVKKHCIEHNEYVLPTYVTPNLRGIASKLSSAAKEARDRGKETQNFFNRWVAKQRSDFVGLVERECKAFYEHDRKVKKLFGLDLMEIPKLNVSKYCYLGDASSYCTYALNAIENERRNKSVFQVPRSLRRFF